jgi:hypothetical protein
MAQVDASIPLSYQPPQLINPAQLLSLRDAQTQSQMRQLALADEQHQQKVRSAVSSVWADPANLDPATGTLNPEALTRLAQIDPNAAAQARQQTASTAELQARAKYYGEQSEDRELKIKSQRMEFSRDGMAASLDAYDRAVSSGASPQQAKEMAVSVGKDKIDEAEKSGIFPPEQIKQLRAGLGNWDPARVRSGLVDTKSWLEQQKTKAKSSAEPPKTRERLQGTQQVQEEWDPATRTWKPIGQGPRFKPGADETAAAPKGDFDKSGDDFLKTLPRADQELIKGIAEGRINPTTSASIRGHERKNLMEQVTQYDPTYNAARPAVWKDFTSGKASNNITAINTAIGHLGTLNRLGEALNNKDVTRVNQLLNVVSTETGHPNVNNYEIAQGAVGDELMRVFRQVGASENEANEWKKRFDAMKSPKQIKGAVATATELLESRINALQDQWKRGSGSDKPFPNLVSPKSRKVLAEAGIKIEGEEGAAAPAAGGVTTISSDEEYAKLPSGAVFVGPDGKRRRKP